ncbi:MAG TPA: PVC-type heme-binding CxxCH protein, partial [Humisphaera sp.]|nr:PVC-type heme-binding CxxCH protein [Humisphaera sp.]
MVKRIIIEKYRRIGRRSILLAATVLIAAAVWHGISVIRSTKAASPIPVTASADPFPTLYNSEPDKTGPMPAALAAARMRLPEGFSASVFASEPDVQNPIAMAWDGRGRLWIAENYTYAENPKRFDLSLRDRILIFEDKAGDGHFSSRKVFTDHVQMLTSIEPGRGGLWVMCPPQLLFIPFKSGGDVPDGPPRIVLDGFTVPKSNYHNFANGLRFGPDGWLYGRCGHSAPGEIGAPGTSPEKRIPLRGTIWRYHPVRKIFEALSSGTTNPWGHDWDEHGELFFVNTVNGHLWHEITGAHYMVSGGTAHTYSLIDQHADHFHFDTMQGWGKSKYGAADAYGGGHAHIGAMIYLADNWPAAFRGHLFTFNMHGLRANQEILERTGSGYVGHHGKDCLFMADKWFRGIDLGYGPDGGVFAIDWSDTGECHESTGVHRTSGRIFKITYGKPKTVDVSDMSKLDSAALVKLHEHPNEWFVRQARRELGDRAVAGVDVSQAASQLRAMFKENTDVVMQLRALWSLYDIGATDEAMLRGLLKHPNEHVRAWAIRLLTDAWPLDTVLSARPPGRDEAPTAALLPELIRVARDDSSGLVRLVLASSLQRLPVEERPALAAELVSHAEDAHDHNLPLLIWYGLIPLGEQDRPALAKLGSRCQLPDTRRCIARRLAEEMATDPAPLNDLLTSALASKSREFQNDVVKGMAEAAKGWRNAPKPAAWDAIAEALSGSEDNAVHDRLRALNVLFGSKGSLDELKKTALDPAAQMSNRQTALQALIDHRPPDLRSFCEPLLKVRELIPIAARGLAITDDPQIANELILAYRECDPKDRPQLLASLASRPTFAAKLLDAVKAGDIPRADLTPAYARQINGFNDKTLTKQLAAVWGEQHDTPADKRLRIAQFKARLTPAALAAADKKNGQLLFHNTCAICHTLYGEGGKVGPDLTGAGRDNLD